MSIAIGGMVGAISRFLIRNIELSIPLDTLAINILGSFLLALILTLAIENLKMHNDVKVGLTAGFFGAFTTFSSVCQESVTMLSKGQTPLAVVYIIVTVVLGMAAAYTGYRLAKRLEARGTDSEEGD
jgi:CrcB protein